MMNVNIEFISSRNAVSYFERAPHIRYFQQMESTMRGIPQGQSPLEYYRDHVARWTRSDKQILAHYINLSVPYIEKYAPGLLSLHDTVRFIKVKRGTEWDFPFTLSGAIVISEKMLNTFKRDLARGCAPVRRNSILGGNALYWGVTPNHDASSGGATPKILAHMTTLVHELVHIHQKKQEHQQTWNRICQRLGFRLKRITLDQRIQQYLVTNPDGYLKIDERGAADAWVMPIDLTEGTVWFYPVLLNMPDSAGHLHFREMLLRLKMDQAGNLSNSGTDMIPIHAFPLYQNRFGVKQLYHPNEITARLISEYIVSGHVYNTVEIRDIVSDLGGI